MNRQLLDPHESDIPERIEEELYAEHRHARCLSFNKRGTLLGTGCHDGSVVLWDFDTRGVIKILTDEEEASTSVVSIAWSSNGRRIIAGDDKGRVRVWDVEKGLLIHRARFESACLTVQFNPRDPSMLLACPNQGQPHISHVDQVGGVCRHATHIFEYF
jgi:COMPASS component SWD1